MLECPSLVIIYRISYFKPWFIKYDPIPIGMKKVIGGYRGFILDESTFLYILQFIFPLKKLSSFSLKYHILGLIHLFFEITIKVFILMTECNKIDTH